jgi:hypothetical protein
VVEIVDDETVEAMLIFKRMECRHTQIFCIAAKSLAEPLEACRPHEGLKTKSAQAPVSTWQGHQAHTPQGGLHSRREILRCPEQVGRSTRAQQPRKVTYPGCPTRLAEP